jgi:hypothetical protein
MEINAYNPGEYAKVYNLTKEEMLLSDDIILMKEITEEVTRFPSVTTADELIEMESKLASLSFKLAALVGRLSSQYEVRERMLRVDIIKYTNDLIKEGKEKTMTKADAVADIEFMGRKNENSIFLGVVDEYKGKSYALKDLFLALTHRIKKFSSNI